VPTFRPDRVLAVEDPAAFNSWVDRLGRAADMEIRDLRDLVEALARRHGKFHESGCRISDYGLETPYSQDFTEAGIKGTFLAVRGGRRPAPDEARAFKTALHMELARMDAKSGWAQQLHIGALRDVNTRQRGLGPATGFDTIGDAPLARPLVGFLDRLDAESSLPKTILYCLNPADNAVLAAMIGNFPQEDVKGKMQFGSAWWFNDQRHGMEEQMKALSDLGLLPRFVGMVTDSRSFLSYPRHEYFRRILCNALGEAVDRGELPRDFELLGAVVRDVCFRNALEYFDVPLKDGKRPL
jgi:glucuronate isomerase